MKCHAIFGPERTWRYKLTREWNPKLPPCVWIMLNPSTADESKDDPTIRRCVGFSINWGFGSIEVYNLFALRSASPEALIGAKERAVGPQNDHFIEAIPADREIVAAWGAFPERLGLRDRDVLMMLSNFAISCLGTTSKGYPRHPLYVPYATARVPLDIRPMPKLEKSA